MSRQRKKHRFLDLLATFDLFPRLREYGRTYGAKLAYVDLDSFYRHFPTPNRTKHALYAAYSDGITIFVDASARATPSSYAWDVLHLYGHMFQWSLDAAAAGEVGTFFFGDAAQTLASGDFRGASADRLVAPFLYEFEANCFGLSILKTILSYSEFTTIEAPFRAYVTDDLSFLIGYYYAGKKSDPSKSVLDSVIRQTGRALRILSLPDASKFSFKRIPKLCVPVLHEVS